MADMMSVDAGRRFLPVTTCTGGWRHVTSITVSITMNTRKLEEGRIGMAIAIEIAIAIATAIAVAIATALAMAKVINK